MLSPPSSGVKAIWISTKRSLGPVQQRPASPPAVPQPAAWGRRLSSRVALSPDWSLTKPASRVKTRNKVTDKVRNKLESLCKRSVGIYIIYTFLILLFADSRARGQHLRQSAGWPTNTCCASCWSACSFAGRRTGRSTRGRRTTTHVRAHTAVRQFRSHLDTIVVPAVMEPQIIRNKYIQRWW